MWGTLCTSVTLSWTKRVVEHMELRKVRGTRTCTFIFLYIHECTHMNVCVHMKARIIK